MSKICQILGNIVFYIMSEKTIEECEWHYNIEQLKREHGIDFVICDNDEVKQQWTYINGIFAPPIPPEGWGYDEETGLFYELNPSSHYEPIDEEKAILARYIIEMEGI